MPEGYRLHIIEDRAGKSRVRTITTSRVDSVPEGAINLEELRQAEIERASEARRRANGHALSALFSSERSREARTEFRDLIHGLPSGSAVYEELDQEKI